ncbi:Polygalacturonase, family GH28 [Zostera marina]|uniref:Polygalacturonase, family GH28 n=1 Tax=Zostera marina TaxID=29655 RepID=A0A0K9PXD9_ZOSMR|nr:Polygalacturonase, family GH28 [Zostera marina]
MSFLQAWDSVCQDSSSSPTLLVPQGYTFLLQSIQFNGPCQSEIHIQILGDLVAPDNTWATSDLANWILFHKVQDLTIDGNGQVDGHGSIWWNCFKNHKCDKRPYLFTIFSCNNFHLSGLKFINSPMMHVVLKGVSGATINGITIDSPQTSPNTDGVHISKSQNVQITDSNISNGDDCISIGAGTQDININGITCTYGHGISIGSLGMNGKVVQVEKIKVSNSNFISTTNGARIKTWQGGSGFARRIIFEHLNFDSVKNPIIIDQNYCPHCKLQ